VLPQCGLIVRACVTKCVILCRHHHVECVLASGQFDNNFTPKSRLNIIIEPYRSGGTTVTYRYNNEQAAIVRRASTTDFELYFFFLILVFFPQKENNVRIMNRTAPIRRILLLLLSSTAAILCQLVHLIYYNIVTSRT